jgi:hypothetical protein
MMERQTAIKLHVEVGADRLLKLPDEVPLGPADVIVLVALPSNESSERGLLGLFEEEPEVVDDAMEYIRSHRQNWRIRPVE